MRKPIIRTGNAPAQAPAVDTITAEVIDPERPAEDLVPWDDGSGAFSTVPETRRITVITDHLLEYPELYLNVFIAGDKYDKQAFVPMFVRASCKKAESVETADLVVFTGGVDVNPAMYDAQRHSSVNHISEDRDNQDLAIYLDCLENGVPMFGVCRGAQFLHVMNGGKLYQDVDNHNGDHTMVDIQTKQKLDRVSSVHHQMCMPNKSGGMEIVATSGKSRIRHISPDETERGNNADIEAFFYRDTCCFGVQGHPEYVGYNSFAMWTLNKINEYVVLNPDVDWEDITVNDEKYVVRRIKPDILKQRAGILQKAIQKVYN